MIITHIFITDMGTEAKDNWTCTNTYSSTSDSTSMDIHSIVSNLSTSFDTAHPQG